MAKHRNFTSQSQQSTAQNSWLWSMWKVHWRVYTSTENVYLQYLKLGQSLETSLWYWTEMVVSQIPEKQKLCLQMLETWMKMCLTTRGNFNSLLITKLGPLKGALSIDSSKLYLASFFRFLYYCWEFFWCLMCIVYERQFKKLASFQILQGNFCFLILKLIFCQKILI